jgi:hypothetical protein
MNATSASHHVGWVPESSNDRGTRSLLYGCLFTLFICSWSAVHLNVPGPDDTAFSFFLRKVKWMGVAIFCPEVITTSAWSDWRNARRLVESLNDQQVSQEFTTVRIFSISPPATDVLIYLQPQQTKSPHRHGDAVPPSSGSNSKPEAKLISDRHNELETLHKVKLTNAQTFVFE